MNEPIFKNSVGTIYKESIHVKELKITVDSLSMLQYIQIQNGKIDFYLITASVVLTILSFVINSLLILYIAIITAISSQLINIKFYYLVFGIHKKQEIILVEINKAKKQDIELFIKQFNIVKGINQPS